MEKFQQRIIGERIELSTRLEKLNQFLESPKFDELPFREKVDLELQAVHMESYLKILNRRIARFK